MKRNKEDLSKVRIILFGSVLTFLFFGCSKQPLVYVQKPHQEVFVRTKKKNTAALAVKLSDRLQIDSLSFLRSILIADCTSHKELIINQLEAGNSVIPVLSFSQVFQKKASIIQSHDEKPKPKFLGKFREKLKKWHPFRRKHRFTRKMTIGLVLLGIAIVLELAIHVQTLTIIFGVAALIYIIQGMKRLF